MLLSLVGVRCCVRDSTSDGWEEGLSVERVGGKREGLEVGWDLIERAKLFIF